MFFVGGFSCENSLRSLVKDRVKTAAVEKQSPDKEGLLVISNQRSPSSSSLFLADADVTFQRVCAFCIIKCACSCVS